MPQPKYNVGDCVIFKPTVNNWDFRIPASTIAIGIIKNIEYLERPNTTYYSIKVNIKYPSVVAEEEIVGLATEMAKLLYV